MKRIFFVSLLGLALFWVISQFVLPLAMGAVLAALLMPMHRRLLAWRIPSALSGLTVALGAVLLFILPIALSIFLVAKAVIDRVAGTGVTASTMTANSFLEGLLRLPPVHWGMSWIERTFSVEFSDMIRGLEQLLQSAALRLAGLLGAFLSQVPSLTLAMVLVVLSLYFFLIDGDRVGRLIDRHSFFSRPQTAVIKSAFAGLSRSVILASVASGLAQAMILTIFGWSLSLEHVGTLAMLVFLTSFIPLVGSSPVTIGLTVIQFIEGHTTKGIALIFAVMLIGTVDNVIRPYILRGAGQLHPLLGFIAALGGIQAFGFWGVFMGPIIAGLFVTTLRLMLEAPVEE